MLFPLRVNEKVGVLNKIISDVVLQSILKTYPRGILYPDGIRAAVTLHKYPDRPFVIVSSYGRQFVR